MPSLKRLAEIGEERKSKPRARILSHFSSQNETAYTKKIFWLVKIVGWTTKDSYSSSPCTNDNETFRLFNLTRNEMVFVLKRYAKNEQKFLKHLNEAEYDIKYGAHVERTGLRVEQLAFLDREANQYIVFPIVCFKHNVSALKWWVYNSDEGKYVNTTKASALELRAALTAQYAVDMAEYQMEITGEDYIVFDAKTISALGEMGTLTMTNYRYNSHGLPEQCEPCQQDADHRNKTERQEDDGSLWAFDPEGDVQFNRKVNPLAYQVTLPYKCIGNGAQYVVGDTRPGYIKNQAGEGESPLLPEDQRVTTQFGSSGYRDAVSNLLTNIGM